MLSTQESVPGCKLSYFLDGVRQELTVHQTPATMGRSIECNVKFPDTVPGMSRHHATLVHDGNTWRLRDAESRNGTFINKVKVKDEPLKPGDVINLGPLPITFELISQTPQRTPGSSGQSTSFAVGPTVEAPIDENEPAPSVSVRISLADMSKTVAAPGSATPESGRNLGSLEEGVYGLNDVATPDEPSQNVSALDVGLFSQVGEILLTSADLDDMLERVMDLVFGQVPAERGLLCLMSKETGLLESRVIRPRDSQTAKLKISKSIANEAINSSSSLLVKDTAADDRFAEAQSIRSLGIKSAMCVPLYLNASKKVIGLIYVDTQSLKKPFEGQDLELMTALSLFSAVALEQARLREEVTNEQKKREQLSRYHSPAVVDQILTGSQDDGLIADECEISVIFADLCGFTSLSEKLPPQDVVRLLNQLFEMLSDCVFHYKGTLDKFMGDGMLAFFGAPLKQDDHAVRAVRAALMMQKKLADYNQSLEDPSKQIGMRIGINSGPAVVGDIGSTKRKDYTIIGDTVNVASRLESSVAKPGQVVMGQKTYESVKLQIVCKPLPPTNLKGKQEPVPSWLADGDTEAGNATNVLDNPVVLTEEP